MKKLLIILLNFLPFGIYSQVWQDVSLDTETNLNAVEFIDPAHGWIIGDSGTILKFENNFWIPVENDFEEYNLYGMHFIDSSNGWIVGDSGLILQYRNDSVLKIPGPTTNKLNDVYMLSDESGWIGGDERTILEYSQHNWTNYPVDTFSRYLRNLKDVQFKDSTFGVFIGGYSGVAGGFTILHYNKGNWYEDKIAVMSYLEGLYIHDKENIFTCESQVDPLNYWGRFIKYNSITEEVTYLHDFGDFGDMGPCRTCDIDFGETKGWAICNKTVYQYNGNRFVEHENNVSMLNSLCMINDTTGWIVGEKGTILKYYATNTGISEIRNNETKVYPNPVKNKLIVKSAVPIKRIEVFNSFGIKTESQKIYNAYSKEINTDNWNPGIHLIKIHTKDSEFIHKVVKN